ncbi:hypothetical protein BGZ81_007166 [Podila clonocystis]|nr:hypothetical protein BGZ81_007166 [Podila clonocystis]
MPGGFKNNRSDGHINSTSSDPNNPVSASAMRAASGNPHGQSYQVAGPTIGGTPTPYDSHNIEIAKEHLAQSLNGGDKDTLNVTSGHGRRSSLTGNIIQGASTAGASVIAAARKLISNDDGNEITEHGVTTPQKDQNVLEFSQQKKVNPADRPPVKIPIHAMKPSDRATYGDLDSPGAHNMPGPLSDRAKVGTPPVVDTNAAKTIADPFGPLNVANWNDGKRHDDVSTPTSEDFESYLDTKPLHRTPIHSSTAPSQAGAFRSSATHGHSPLKNEAAYIASDPSRNLLTDTHTTVHSSRNEAPVAPTAVKSSANHSAALSGAGAGAVGAGIAAASMHHDVHAPVSHPVSQTTTTVPVAQAPQIKKIPIAQPPAPEKRIPITQPAAEVKRASVGQPPSQVQQHPIQTTTSQHFPMSSATTSHTHAVPIAATAATAGTAAAAMKSDNHVASVEHRESVTDRVKSFFHHDHSSGIPKDNSANVAATEASVLLANQDYANKHSAPVESRSLSETAPITGTAAAVTGATAGTAAYLGTRKDGVLHATADAPVAHHYDTELAPGALHTAPAVHNTHTVPIAEKVKTKAPIVGAAAGTAGYIGIKSFRDPPITHTSSTMAPMADSDPMVHSTAPVVSMASAPVAQKLTTTTIDRTEPSRPFTENVTAPLVGAAAGTAAYMGAKKEQVKEAIHKTTHHDSAKPVETHAAVNPIEHVEYSLRPEHPTTASVPVHTATTTTTHVPDAKKATVEHHHHLPYEKIAVPLTSAAIGTTAYISQRRDSEKESRLHRDVNTTTHTTVPGSHSTTSVPVAHTTNVDHHNASEYGPANPKDLHLEDPSMVRTMGAPIGAAAATTAAVIGAKEAKAAHTTHTTPTTHVESTKPAAPMTTGSSTTTAQKPIMAPTSSTTHTSSTTRPNPVLAAPHPVVPSTVNAKSTTTTHNAAPLAAATVAAAAPMAASAYRNTTTSTTTSNSRVPAPVSNTTASSGYTTTNANTTPGANTITSSTVRRPSAVEIETADKIAAAIPATYKGPIPTVNQGEEVIWVKTVTTTDFYDDEAAGIVDRNGDVVSTQQDVLAPNASATVKDGSTTYTNTVENQNQAGFDGGRRRSSGFMDRLMGRQPSPNGDKGKQRKKKKKKKREQ